MNNHDFFTENKYCLVEAVLAPDISNMFKQYTIFDEKQNFSPESKEAQVPGAHTKYADPLMESLLINLLPIMEENTGLELFPTYSYYRVYRSGDQLLPHIDRPSCEISATLCMGFYYPDDYEGWPIFIEDQGFIMGPGDMIIYRGMDLTHYRYPFEVDEGYFHSQVFLHYVDKNGPHKEFRFDKRESLGIK